VERPASVVKELLENALDAGSTRIRIHVEAGGKKVIQIIDNGCGMVRDDAMLAFERHATSKIKDTEDSSASRLLDSEAKPCRRLLRSRASIWRRVRKKSLRHGDRDQRRKNDRVKKRAAAGLDHGTRSFFNTPARKKFLKAESTELSHIASLVTH